MIEVSGLTPEQVIYGKLEDAEKRAERLDPHAPHRDAELAKQDAAQYAAMLADLFRARSDEHEHELAKYRAEATWGE